MPTQITRQFAARVVAAALAAAGVSGGAWATTIVRVPFDEMVRRSGLIVRATVIETHVEIRPARGRPLTSRHPKTGVRPRIEAPRGGTTGHTPAPVGLDVGGDGGPVPFTHITLAIEEAIKGTLTSRILKLRMPGGPIGNRRLEVLGLPSFEIGRRYYLFLRPDHQIVGDFIVGVDQGFFRIERDPSTGADVLSDHGGHLVAGVEHGAVTRLAGVKRHAAPLTPAGLTSLVRSVPGWDELPVMPSQGGLP